MADRQWLLTAWIACHLLLHAVPTSAQVNQSVLAGQLSAGNAAERSQAVQAASRISVDRMTPELRSALIKLLERENAVVAEAARIGQPVAIFEDPLLITHLARVVADLRDPAAIPALSRAAYGSTPVMRALVEFGNQAVPSLTEVVTAPDSDYELVNHGLRSLRFIVEAHGTESLSPEVVRDIRLAVEQRLTGHQFFTTLWRAMDLAMVLGDPDLLRVVETLASDRKEVIARGVTRPDIIEMTQRYAADRLAGVPPLPRCC